MANQDHAVRNEELLAQAQAGDTDACAAIIATHGSLIQNTVRRAVGESSSRAQKSELISTITREASALARRDFERFSGSYPQLRHWISVISRDHALRTVRRRQSAGTAEHVDEFGYWTGNPAHVLPGAAAQTARRVNSNDQAWALLIFEQSLDRLHEDDADLHQLMWLKYKKRWSDQQIQIFLEEAGDPISVSEVGERIEKGRAYLGACIRERSGNG